MSREATGEEKVRQASRSLRNSGSRTILRPPHTHARRTPFSVAALAHHGHTCRSAKGWDKSRQARHVATVTQNGSTGRPPPTAHECATDALTWQLLHTTANLTLQLRPGVQLAKREAVTEGGSAALAALVHKTSQSMTAPRRLSPKAPDLVALACQGRPAPGKCGCMDLLVPITGLA